MGYPCQSLASTSVEQMNVAANAISASQGMENISSLPSKHVLIDHLTSVTMENNMIIPGATHYAKEKFKKI